jgi:hypothetical protein
MALNDEKKNDDFADAFKEDTPYTAKPTEDETFGLTPSSEEGTPAADAVAPGADAAETAGGAEGEPASVTIAVATGEGPDAGSESSANSAAAAEAKAATDEMNAVATDNRSPGPSTGEKEAAAAAGGGGDKAKVDTVAVVDTPAVDAIVADDAPAAGGLDDMSDVPAEDTQKFKSWQGRLKKIEADLKAKADAAAAGQPETNGPVSDGSNTESQTADALDQVAAEAPDAGLAEAAQEAATAVESGELTPEQAMAQLAEDFGEPFVKLIELIARTAAGKVADEKVGAVGKSVEDVIGHLTSQAERAHFKAIHAAHPDFIEVDKDPAFKEWVAANAKEQVVDTGDAESIIALLDEFKAGGAPAGGEAAPAAEAAPAGDAMATPAQDAVAAASEAADEGEVDAAEGVRSAGLRLPDEPTKSKDDDYEAAWKSF